VIALQVFVHTGSSGEGLPHGPWLGLFGSPAPLKSMVKKPLPAKIALHGVGRLGPPARAVDAGAQDLSVLRLIYYYAYSCFNIRSEVVARRWRMSNVTLAISLALVEWYNISCVAYLWLTSPPPFHARLLDSARTDPV
jgi:hypothetical protein